MNRQILLTILAIGAGILMAQAQTSYGNLIQGNAGTGGGVTSSYFGYEAGTISAGDHNTGIGYQTLYANTIGHRNTATGSGALFSNTEGYQNTANGSFTLYSNTEGFHNTAVGYGALYYNTEGDYNTATGSLALFKSTGESNTATGYGALFENTTGYRNTATGRSALYYNTEGYQNTATGYGALYRNTTGYFNTATGYNALYSNTIGGNNTVNGRRALYYNTTGHWNTANGSEALFYNTTGFWNTANGSSALHFNTTGYYNTANGFFSLHHNTTGNNNTAVGRSSGPASGNGALNNTTSLGYGATPTASNQVRIGNSSVTSIGGYAPWSNLSDGRFKKNVKEDIPGLDFINQLRPVSYELKHQQLNTFLGMDKKREAVEEMAAASGIGLAALAPDIPSVTRRQIGFVAQEVEQVLNEKGYGPIGIEVPQNEHDHYSIRYAEFVVPLVKAVQELSTDVQELKEENERQKQQITTLLKQLGNSGSGEYSSPALSSPEGFELFQNVPNPFSQSTTIHAVVPEGVQQAKMVICNLQGTELESYELTGSGRVSVEISAGRFPAGIYLYGLIADGQLVDTKRMILEK